MRAAPGDAEDLVVGGQPGPAHPAAQRTHRKPVQRRAVGLGRKGAAQRRDRLVAAAASPAGRTPGRSRRQPRDCRMQVDVLVPVDVVERRPVAAKRRELRADFSRELAPGSGPKEKSNAGPHLVVEKPPVPSEQRGHRRRRRAGLAVDQHEMQADLAAPAAAAPAPPRRRRRARRPSGWRRSGCRRGGLARSPR